MKRIINNKVHPPKRLHFVCFVSWILMPFLVFASCSSFIKIDDPVDKVMTSDVFADEQTATSVVLGLYSKLLTRPLTFTSGAITVYSGLAADEFYHTGAVASYLQFQTNNILQNSGVMSGAFWTLAYDYIYQANICIDGLNNSTLNPATKNQLLGEAHTIRAFCYWYLLNLFGDVPLILGTDYEENMIIGRTASDAVFEQILADLEIANELLDADYYGNDRERINKWTVMAFLARVHLYLENWILAKQYASEVIAQPDYILEEDLNSVFLIESKEVIWRLVERTANLQPPVEASSFLPTVVPNARPLCAMTDELLGAFDAEDHRLANWTTSITVLGTTYICPLKFKYRYPTFGLTEAIVPFRLSELYLIRAEAQAQLDEYTEALNDLNAVRNRSNLNNVASSDKAEILDLILRERRIEFFAEWGHRWFDLKRTGKIDEVLGSAKPNWQPTAALWPIPLSQILSNPNLTQNLGYE